MSKIDRLNGERGQLWLVRLKSGRHAHAANTAASCLDCLDSCLDGSLNSCLDCLDSCLDASLDSCLDSSLDSCLDTLIIILTGRFI